MSNSKSLFIVYTTYQMLSALSTIETFHVKEFDVLIMHKNMIPYSIFLKNSGCEFVYIYEELFDKTPNYGRFRNHLCVLKNIIRKLAFFRKNKNLLGEYSHLFVPSDDSSCRVVYKVLQKSQHVSLNLFDDGVGTYSGYIYKKKSPLSRFLYSALLNKHFYEKLENIYCYMPDLIVKNPYNINAKRIFFNPHSEVFSDDVYNSINKYNHKKVIFLDQGIKDKPYIFESLSMLANVFGRENVIIKKHPRIDGNAFYKGFLMSSDGFPIESLASVLDLNKCVIISHSSTGCITPFLLNSCRPFAILLSRMDNHKASTIDIGFFEKINNYYGPNSILLPNDINELRDAIDMICGEVKETKLIVKKK